MGNGISRAQNVRELVIVALLLAVGAVMRIASPSIGHITPNWMIALYCLAIILIRPTIGKAFAIGLVAGALCVVTSKSAFPYANLISEPLGAIVCAFLVNRTGEMSIGKFALKPFVAAALSTFVSGTAFIIVTKLVLNVPNEVFFYAMFLGVVVPVTISNGVFTQILALPASRFAVNRPAIEE